MSHDPAALPGAGLQLNDPAIVIDLFDRAAAANLESSWRRGATAALSPRGRLVIAGDLHDHVRNFQRVLQLADLPASPEHHVLIQEVIHGPHRVNGMDLSIRTLARAAALKRAFPAQVHILQGNHELAQIAGVGILKNGTSVTAAFDDGVDYIFGGEADAVRQAMGRFVRSLLLAVRCPRGILCTHSLPGERHLPAFDPAVLDRVPTEADLAHGGSAHSLVWGRSHPQGLADQLAQAWGAKVFVLGHQPAEDGYRRQGDTMLILASDHDHGVALPIDLAQEYDREALIERIVPLAGV